MERIVLHSDCNAFYASVECLYRPEIRNKPVAVGGDAELRHGIVYGASSKCTMRRRYCNLRIFMI